MFYLQNVTMTNSLALIRSIKSSSEIASKVFVAKIVTIVVIATNKIDRIQFFFMVNFVFNDSIAVWITIVAFSNQIIKSSETEVNYVFIILMCRQMTH